MKFNREDYSSELMDVMMPLMKAHDAEVPGLPGIKLDPNLDAYKAMDLAGILRIYTVRDNDGVLQGYQVMIVSKHPHSKNSLQAIQDILYINPDARKGLLGYQFISWCCARLKAEGVQVVHQYLSVNNNFGKMLERMGYELTDLAFARRLN